ncbi:OsmC family protein [Alkalicoccus saliphilus]|uniref:Osmotically inducible protein C n=1 Tax=Alkalicoccus saliphilus TaxID=200989 RepID=A0A2T4U6P8_9BACI|nr:OsmC family protein [Alkalicoccus saliphilus]PTL39078.1 osmotically inducible protein C [Alkalicoccus saliphilus]
MSEKMRFEVSGKAKNMTAELQAKNHTIIIDEPAEMGGADKGQDPLSNMLASLAGCENVIANMVAKEMEFDLQGIDFEVSGELDPRGLMGQEGVTPYFYDVQIQASVSTSESEERIQELKQKTDARCPVYTTFEAANIPITATWTRA